MKSLIIYLVALFLSFEIIFTAELQDSTKVFYLKPVLVTATRSEILVEKSPTVASVLTKEQLKFLNTRTLADVLNLQEGIFIKDYGPVSGLKTISSKGTSVESNLILINGIRINNFQNGLVDLSLLSSDIIDKIELVHGGNTPLYGTDAIGSVVNILTNDPSERPRANFALSKGSFDYNKLGLSIANTYKNFGINFTFSREYGKDNYKFVNPSNSEIKIRENSNFSKNSYYLSTNFKLGNLSIKTYTTFVNSEKNLPGSLSFPSTTASQHDKGVFLQLLSKYQINERLYFELNNGFNYSYQKYLEPIFSVSSFSKNIQTLINPQIIYQSIENRTIILGFELINGFLNGKDYSKTISRSQKSAYLTGIYSFDFDYSVLNNVSLYPTLRYESFSNIGSEFSPKFGLNIGTLKGLHLKTNISWNYRVPTLNDLYYTDAFGNKGNPNLKPEYTSTIDAGFSYSSEIKGRMDFEYLYFYVNTKNKIVWKEILPWVYSPVNFDKVLSKGNLIKIIYQIKNYTLAVNYTFTDAKKKSKTADIDPTYNKQLIYTPENIWKFNFVIDYDLISVGLNHIIVGKRYVDEQNLNSLPAYRITDGNIRLNYNSSYVKFYLKFEVNNIFNTSYQILKDYPMPLRNYRLTFGMDY